MNSVNLDTEKCPGTPLQFRLELISVKGKNNESRKWAISIKRTKKKVKQETEPK